MEANQAAPQSIDEYIAAFSTEVREILEKIRQVVRGAALGAEEAISYRMPTFKLNGVLVHFAAFKNHIGLYPPTKGDAALEEAIRPYAGEKGNLRFPLDQPIPYDLIERIVKLRVQQTPGKGFGEARQEGVSGLLAVRLSEHPLKHPDAGPGALSSGGRAGRRALWPARGRYWGGQVPVRAPYQAAAWLAKVGFQRCGRARATRSARRVWRRVFTCAGSVMAPTAMVAIFVTLRIASANWTWNMRP
jgi:uncharacterized protein YdhG (YjbR/CyaY superfamily)